MTTFTTAIANSQLGDEVLPDDMPETWTDEQLKALHHVLMEVCLSVRDDE
jgi:hypothetical protein